MEIKIKKAKQLFRLFTLMFVGTAINF